MGHRHRILKATLVGTFACVTCTILALLAVNGIPHLLPALLGMERIGHLENMLPPGPIPLNLDGFYLDQVELLLPPRLREPISLALIDLERGEFIGRTVTPGTSTYLLTLDEASLNALLRRWFLPDGVVSDRYRDLWVDLQPGGLILYADVNLGLRWRRMGLLLLQDKTALSPTGLVMDQELYTLPGDGFLARAIPRVESYTGQTLEALTLVGPLPGEARVSLVQFHADRIEILAQTAHTVSPPLDSGWQPLESGVELRQVDVAAGSVLERLAIVRLDPAAVHFRVHYDPTNPRLVSEWATWLQPLLVVNAGYFTSENETTGLLISGGQSWGIPFENFAGMFAVTANGQVSVRWLRERLYDSEEPLVEAVQSFPVLIKPGGMMGFPADADEGNLARRTVVAQDRNGSILVVVASRGYLSLHELAVFLANSDMEIDVALNLDGGGSSGLWLETGDVDLNVDSSTAVPSVIVVGKQ